MCTNPPLDITREIPLGTGGTTISWVEITATDDCGEVTLLYRNYAPGNFFSIGRTSVSYRFADYAGNSVTCSFDILVNEGWLIKF